MEQKGQQPQSLVQLVRMGQNSGAATTLLASLLPHNLLLKNIPIFPEICPKCKSLRVRLETE